MYKIFFCIAEKYFELIVKKKSLKLFVAYFYKAENLRN